MRNKIAGFLRTAHTCLLLVSPEIRRLEDAADELLSVYAWPHLPVGHELGTALLSENPQRRSHAVQRWMKARISEMSPGPVLCTGIALLFEPTLGLDPLRLLRDVGRTTRLVIAWPGTYERDVLAYAVPGHSHYRTWRKPEVSILILDQPGSQQKGS
jgi:hypothetical protein